MAKILTRSIYRNDYKLINFWIKDSLIKNKIQINKIYPNKNIKIIISDNIRIGMQLKKKNREFYFIYPSYYTLGYLNKNFSYKVYGKNFENVNYFYDEIKKKENIKNILIVKKKFKNFKKKILILGNKSRNKKLIKFLKKNNCQISITNNYLKENEVINNQYDFIVSSGYQFKITSKILSKYSDRIFNLHATFLPWGKGIGTTLFSFLLQQPTGSSIHLIDKKFDTGDLIFRKFIQAKNSDTTRTFYKKLMIMTEKIAISNLLQIFNSNFKRKPQKDFLVKPPYFSRFDFEKIIRILPLGYDTKIKTLVGLGNILRENNNFLKNYTK